MKAELVSYIRVFALSSGCWQCGSECTGASPTRDM